MVPTSFSICKLSIMIFEAVGVFMYCFIKFMTIFSYVHILLLLLGIIR